MSWRLTNSQRDLVECNINIAYDVAHHTYHPHIALEDAIQLAMLGLCIAAHHYDPSKGKFSTLAYLSASQQIHMEERKYNSLIAYAIWTARSLDSTARDENVEVPMLIPDSKSDTQAQAIASCQLKQIFEFRERLSERDKLVFDLFVLEGQYQAVVAEAVGCSQSHVSRIATRLLNQLRAIVDPIAS